MIGRTRDASASSRTAAGAFHHRLACRLRPAILVPPVDTHAGGRVRGSVARMGGERAAALGIPVIALEAYAYAARVAEAENPKCHLAWTTLAGIGRWRVNTDLPGRQDCAQWDM